MTAHEFARQLLAGPDLLIVAADHVGGREIMSTPEVESIRTRFGTGEPMTPLLVIRPYGAETLAELADDEQDNFVDLAWGRIFGNDPDA